MNYGMFVKMMVTVQSWSQKSVPRLHIGYRVAFEEWTLPSGNDCYIAIEHGDL